MESSVGVTSQLSTSSTNLAEPMENMVSNHPNNGEAEPPRDVIPDEITSIMEVIAATGKFWHDWSYLKGVLFFRLKQVLAEYPESQSVGELQLSSLSGETYLEMERRLNDALLSFEEGPPFTLQRLCEILLSPKSTYTTLAKLALALEKNLLVTSTLTKSTEPYPITAGKRTGNANKESDEMSGNSNPVPNGAETSAGDADEEMADAEADEEAADRDTEMQEEKANETADTNAEQDPVSDVSDDPATVASHQPSTSPAPEAN